MTYLEAKIVRDELERLNKQAIDNLKAISGKPGPMGLTSDTIKSTPAWKQAHSEMWRTADVLKRHVGLMVKRFAREMREERNARRQAKRMTAT